MYAKPLKSRHRTQSSRFFCLRVGQLTTGVVEWYPFFRIFRFRMYWFRLMTTANANVDPGFPYVRALRIVFMHRQYRTV